MHHKVEARTFQRENWDFFWGKIGSPFASLLSPNGLPASRFRDKWQMWNGKRKACFSPSRIVSFLPVQKSYVPAGRGQNDTCFGKDVTKNVTSQKKYFRLRERHILPRHMTNVTRHIFCHRKKWQMWRHSPKSETGSWEEIRVRPTLSPVIRLGLRTPRKKERKNAPSMMHSQSHLGCHFRKLKAHSSNVSFAMFRCKETFELWALSFETAFENVTPSGIGYTRRAGWPSLTFTPGKVLQACGTRWHHWKLNGNELNCVLKKKKSPISILRAQGGMRSKYFQVSY